MKNIKNLIIYFSLLVIILSCENGTETIIEKDPEPGRRDYVWQWDTLDMQMNTINAVWGANANDVWAVGPGGREQDRLWHYDGNKWSAYSKELIYCTGNTLYGFSANDIWMGGGAGWQGPGAAIWHYNGSKWAKHYIHKIESSYAVYIDDIWGTSNKNIYACGMYAMKDPTREDFYGILLHWDGSSWKEIYRADFESQFQRVRKYENTVFIMSYERKTSMYHIYKLTNNILTEFYSGYAGDINTAQFDIIDNNLYFSIGNIFYKYNNGNMEEFLQFASGFQQYFFGNNSMDIFFLRKDGLLHYNGEDVQPILKQSMQVMATSNGIKSDTEYFQGYLATNSNANIILHGKLKE